MGKLTVEKSLWIDYRIFCCISINFSEIKNPKDIVSLKFLGK